MARPLKNGVDYWAFDCDLFEDKKIRLIRSEFGCKGVYTAIKLISACYREGGYYKSWDDEDCFLIAEGEGLAPGFVAEVVKGCIKRGLFNETVFDTFRVLTSAGIQRRFLRAVAKNRESTIITEEYWLLDISSERDVPDGILCKLDFKKLNGMGNSIINTENYKKRLENLQNKIEQNKLKYSKESGAAGNSFIEKSHDIEDFYRQALEKTMGKTSG